MDAMNALKEAANNAGVPLSHIGRKMGLADNYVNKTIGRGSTPKADTLARMLETCGYALCAIPANKIPKNALQITYEEQATDN